MRPDRDALRFVRVLARGGSAKRREQEFVAASARLSVRQVRELVAAGVLALVGDECTAGQDARTWLRRGMIEGDQFAAQHQVAVRGADGTIVNLADNVLALLARPGRGEDAFLDAAQVEAGERVRRLAERARLQPRLTMSYSATHTVSGKAGGGAGEIGDMAADARRQLGELVAMLPRDCAGVVMDVCGLEKGLQAVEAERGWPRRSAKLVLRIGLDQLARHFGLSAQARGKETGKVRGWLGDGARPGVFG